MSYDNPNTDRRIALWHEAGHAVAAMAMGLPIKSLGIYPMPHCLVDHKGVSDEDMGILLCAGAMMTSHIYNIEWGTDTDYKMASALGDLDHFRAKALELVKANCGKARLIVDELSAGTRSGSENLVLRYGSKLFLRDDHCLYYPELPCEVLEAGTPEHTEVVSMVEATRPNKITVKVIRFLANMNIKHPAKMAKLSALTAKLGI